MCTARCSLLSPRHFHLFGEEEKSHCVYVPWWGRLPDAPFSSPFTPLSYLPMHVHTHILIRTDCVTRICPFALLVISSSLPPFFFQATIITMHPPPPVRNLEILDALLLFPPPVKRTNFETLHARRFPVNKKERKRGCAPDFFSFREILVRRVTRG